MSNAAATDLDSRLGEEFEHEAVPAASGVGAWMGRLTRFLAW